MNNNVEALLSPFMVKQILKVWIFLTMLAGIIIGYIYHNTASAIGSLIIGTTSIPIAIGLILIGFD